ncbi:MAG: S9 family peptidase [Acidobacteriaceae bacterium]|nr:S9 family peptidase [Acidobacteriaceae bacterium]
MTRITFALLFNASFVAAQLSYPPAPRKPVTDTYHGVKVIDDYRWLEDFNDPAVKQWAWAESAVARSFLDALPERAVMAKELAAMYAHQGVRYGYMEQRGSIFATKRDPQHQHAILITLASLDNPASEHVVLDPDTIDPKHLTAIDFVSPSADGRYVAVSLSSGGSESGDLHVYEVATGRALPEVIPGVNRGTAGGSVAWNAQGTGFYYTRYPHAGERAPEDLNFYQQIYFHKLGDPTERDTYSLGKEFPRIAEIQLESSRDARFIAATVRIGDGGDMQHWLLTPGHEWRQLARVSDEVKQLAFGFDSDLYLLSKQNALRAKVLHLRANETFAQATVVIPESEVVIDGIYPSRAGLFVVDLAGGPSDARFLPANSAQSVSVPVPPISSVFGAAPLDDGSFVFPVASYLAPLAWFRFDPRSHKVLPTALREASPVPTDNFEVVREFVTSKDGANVPLNIIRPKGLVLDGSHPTVLTGYGGYGVNITPFMSINTLALLQHGIVFAEANLRGGGEFGEQWHEQGKLTKKQNVFDDFAACAEHLISRKYTQSARLGIIGGSNGGLLMGAALTQHPDLYHAVVSEVGIYDMLRVELSPNGAFNVTEFGTVKEADQFRALYAYSPYHHVHDGTQYPAILFTTGDNDPRVDPMNSRKMAARLQATGTREPVLLRTSSKAGHGIGSSRDEQISLSADVDAFLIHELRADATTTARTDQ